MTACGGAAPSWLPHWWDDRKVWLEACHKRHQPSPAPPLHASPPSPVILPSYVLDKAQSKTGHSSSSLLPPQAQALPFTRTAPPSPSTPHTPDFRACIYEHEVMRPHFAAVGLVVEDGRVCPCAFGGPSSSGHALPCAGLCTTSLCPHHCRRCRMKRSLSLGAHPVRQPMLPLKAAGALCQRPQPAHLRPRCRGSRGRWPRQPGQRP